GLPDVPPRPHPLRLGPRLHVVGLRRPGQRALPRLLRAAVRALRALVLDRGVFLGGRLRPGQRLRAGPVVDGGRARLALQRDVPVDFVTVLIGLFAIGEVLDQIVGTSSEPAAETPRARAVPRLPLLALWPLRGPLVRGPAVGIAVVGLAGAGATVSSFVSYGLEKQISRTPELFGTGHAG